MIYAVCYEGEEYHGGILRNFNDYLKAKEYFLFIKDNPVHQDDICIYITESTDDEEYVCELLHYNYPQ